MMRPLNMVPITNTMSGMQQTDPEEVQLQQMFSQMENDIRNAPPPPQVSAPPTPDLWKLLLGSALSNFGSTLARNPVFAEQNANYLDQVRSAPGIAEAHNLEAQMEDSKQRIKRLQDISFQRLEYQQKLAEREGDTEKALKIEQKKHDLLMLRNKANDESDLKKITARGEESRKTVRERGERQRTTNAAKPQAAGKVNVDPVRLKRTMEAVKIAESAALAKDKNFFKEASKLFSGNELAAKRKVHLDEQARIKTYYSKMRAKVNSDARK